MAVETHAPVANQSVPFEDVDLLAGDAALRDALEREGGGWALELVREAGVTAGSAVAQAHGRRAERNEPRLITHDRFGHRVDRVELDPSWHWLLAGALCGMAMTEKQGGSDVRANTTRADAAGDGWWELTGHKWFCSYPPCD